jgi:hypothetical protein
MSKLKRPLRLWHGLLAIAAALAIGAGGTAIAGDHGKGKNLTTAGLPAGGVFRDAGKYHYGVKVKGTHDGDSQTDVKLKCPRGTRVIGGGGGGSSGDPTEQSINFSGPFDTRDRGRVPDDGWIMYMNNQGLEGNEAIVVQAICRDQG